MLSYKEQASKYAIYVRKSTDEIWKQEKSIEDQLTYCKTLSERDNLNVEVIIEEKRSAKLPHKRPYFDDLIKKIEKWHLDGIIAYHPDRLARNMLEAGIVIDMVDRGVIADLRFCTQQFSKDANWKMLLGMAFVLSKQYSDKISDDVSRARDERHIEGQTNGIFKPWYERDKDGRYTKGKFWDIIKQAWSMKLSGKKNKDIVQFLSSAGYYREIKGWKTAQSRQYMTEQKLASMFQDPFYYGELVVNNKPIKLRDLYGFIPTVTEEEFYRISQKSRMNNYRIQEGKPLKGKIYDFEHPEIEYKPQIINNGKWNTYLMYVIDPKTKKAIEKSTGKKFQGIRAKTIVHSIDISLQKMRDNLAKNEAKFDAYRRKAEKQLIEMQDDKRNQLMVLRKTQNRMELELNELADSFIMRWKDYSPQETKRYREKTRELEEAIENIKIDVEDLGKKIKSSGITLKDFLNTLETLIWSYKDRSWDDKLKLAEILVLNIFIKGWEVHQIELSDPFNTLLANNNPIWLPG